MKLTQKTIKSPAFVFSIQDAGKPIATGRLFLITNHHRTQPYGIMEMVTVDPAYRGQGLGSKIVKAIIAEARAQNCYKLIATSRHKSIPTHKLYQKLGFKNHGLEFRMDFKDSQPTQDLNKLSL